MDSDLELADGMSALSEKLDRTSSVEGKQLTRHPDFNRFAHSELQLPTELRVCFLSMLDCIARYKGCLVFRKKKEEDIRLPALIAMQTTRH